MTGHCTPTCRDRDCPCTAADDPNYEAALEAEADWYVDGRGVRHELGGER